MDDEYLRHTMNTFVTLPAVFLPPLAERSIEAGPATCHGIMTSGRAPYPCADDGQVHNPNLEKG